MTEQVDSNPNGAFRITDHGTLFEVEVPEHWTYRVYQDGEPIRSIHVSMDQLDDLVEHLQALQQLQEVPEP